MKVSSEDGNGRPSIFLIEGKGKQRTASRLPDCRDGSAIVSKNYKSKG